MLVIAVLAVLWPGGGPVGIAWADVAQQLMAAQTMDGPLERTVVAPDGHTRVVTGRVYYKDPGSCRIESDEEVVTAPDGTTTRSVPPTTVVVVKALAEDVITLEVIPERHEAIRTELDITGTLLGPWRELQLNPAAMAWFKLREVAADATRVIGRRRVAGEPAIGFAAPLADVMGPQPLGIEPQGEVRVWASVETAIPLAVEIETTLGGGWSVTEVVEPVRWDAPLPDSLFDDSVIAGYEVHERKAHTRGFPETELAPHVTLRIGPATGGSVVNELDVVGAVTGTVSFEPWQKQRYRTIITFELTAEAAERLETYLEEHPDTPLGVDFNGEFLRPWLFRRVMSRLIQVEVTPLRKRLIDFEREYLVHGEEAAAAEVERQRGLTPTPSGGE